MLFDVLESMMLIGSENVNFAARTTTRKTRSRVFVDIVEFVETLKLKFYFKVIPFTNLHV